MQVLQIIVMIIAAISGIALVTTITMQTTSVEGFSAAMGGSDSAHFRKGSREEMLDRVTKVMAIVWIIACALNAVLYFHLPHGPTP